MRERELRRRISATITEAGSHYVGWEDYAPQWKAPIPPHFMGALVRICAGVAEHIEQNYPPCPEFSSMQDPYASDPQHEWMQEIKRASRNDPTVERALHGVIAIFKSLIPSNLRTHVSAAEPSYEMVAARDHFMHAVASPLRRFKDNPESGVKILLGQFALIWGSYSTRKNLTESAARDLEQMWWSFRRKVGNREIDKRWIAAIFKICRDTQNHILEENPPPDTLGPYTWGVPHDWSLERWEKRTREAAMQDPVVDRSAMAIIHLFRALLPLELRGSVELDDARSINRVKGACVNLFVPHGREDRFVPGSDYHIIDLLSLMVEHYMSEAGIILV